VAVVVVAVVVVVVVVVVVAAAAAAAAAVVVVVIVVVVVKQSNITLVIFCVSLSKIAITDDYIQSFQPQPHSPIASLLTFKIPSCTVVQKLTRFQRVARSPCDN